MSWRAEMQCDGNAHVFPDDERAEHLIDTTLCECRPRVTHNFGGRMVVVHRSHDGRELIEEAQRIIANA
jgi:hypothetical protein